MTLRKNLTKGERFAIMEKKIANLEMSQRVSQMLLQQIGNSVSPMAKDVGELAARQRDSQYRLLAVQSLLALNIDTINKTAEELQVKDFNETSDKEDAEKSYTVADTVTDDTVVILTSKTPSETEDKGYLRSKLLVKEIGFPELRKDLVGKKVGDTITADINGVQHAITVLGIRNVPAPVEVVDATEELPTELKQVNG